MESREHRTPLSYMQLVEVAFVAFFRQIGVPMPRIRSAKEYVAQTFRAEYPFVQLEFKTEGFHVLMDYQQFYPAHEFRKAIVADSNGQLAWTDLLGEKFAEFDYEHELALRWHPAGRNSPVVLDPRVAFGAPTVQGLPTWTLKGRYLAGEEVDEIVDDFDLARELVIEGLRFEGVRIEELV